MTDPSRVRVLVDGQWRFEHTCDHCGILFTSARPHTRYHNTRCRMRAYRHRLAEQETTGND